MSSIPANQDVQVYVYADDIAFFAADNDIYSLYQKLQRYLSMLEVWLQSICMTLNVSKSAILVFPLTDPVSVSIVYNQEPIPQVESLKYLGIIYDGKLNWSPHIENVASKAQRTCFRFTTQTEQPKVWATQGCPHNDIQNVHASNIGIRLCIILRKPCL